MVCSGAVALIRLSRHRLRGLLWLLAGGQRHHRARRSGAEAWRASPDRLGDIARSQMTVVLFDHAGVAMPEVLGNDDQRHPVHDRQARPSMAQPVERDRRPDLGAPDGLVHRPALVGWLPLAAVGTLEHEFTAAAAGAVLKEEFGTLRRQHDVARLAALGLANGDGAGVGIEVVHFEARKLRIPTAGLQCRTHQRPEIRLTGIEQAFRFRHRKITDTRRLHALVRLQLAIPGVTIVDVTFVIGVVERRLQHRQHAIGAGPPRPHFVVSARCVPILRLAGLGAALRRRCRHGRVPFPQALGSEFGDHRVTKHRHDVHIAATDDVADRLPHGALVLDVELHRLPNRDALDLVIAAVGRRHHGAGLGFGLLEVEHGKAIGVVGVVGHTECLHSILAIADVAPQHPASRGRTLPALIAEVHPTPHQGLPMRLAAALEAAAGRPAGHFGVLYGAGRGSLPNQFATKDGPKIEAIRDRLSSFAVVVNVGLTGVFTSAVVRRR
jgi:hypothetical protein